MALERFASIGSISVVASTLVTIKYLNGFVPETSMASICSVTRIDPNSAPMPEPILPAQISAVITGEISRTSDTATIEGRSDSAPNSTKVGRDWMVSTNPIINAVIATSGSDLYPTQ